MGMAPVVRYSENPHRADPKRCARLPPVTTGKTPYYNLVFPYGDEPMSNIDDLIRKLATDIDTLLHNAAVGRVVAFRLAWTGTVAMASNEEVKPVYTVATDYTDGVGYVPAYSFENGVTVPSTGIWHVEAWSAFDNKNPNGTNVALKSIIYSNNNPLRSEVVLIDLGDTGNLQVFSAFTGWFEAGDVVRGGALSTHAPTDLHDSVVRLIGPMNVGAGFLPGGLG